MMVTGQRVCKDAGWICPVGGTPSRPSFRLGLHSAGESITADHSQLVNPASDSFVRVVGLELKRDEVTVAVDNASLAGYLLAQWRGRQVLNVHMHPDRTFTLFQQGQHGLTGSMFEEPDQPWRGEDCRHLVVGKVDGMLFGDDEGEFTGLASFRTTFHVDPISG